MFVKSISFRSGTCIVSFAARGETVIASLPGMKAWRLSTTETPLPLNDRPASCGPFELESVGVRFVTIVQAQLPGIDEGSTVLVSLGALTALIADLRAIFAETNAARDPDRTRTLSGTWMRESERHQLTRLSDSRGSGLPEPV